MRILLSLIPNASDVRDVRRELGEQLLLAQIGIDGEGRLHVLEGEVALAFTVAILSRLGATAEQIDRERSRVHDELFNAHRA